MNTSFPASYRITLMLLILYALALVPFSAALPGWVSYENNLLENAQVIVLLGGALLCIHFAHYSQGSPTHGMWLPSAVVFLILAFRELSWGRVFMVKGYSAIGEPIIPGSSEMPFHTAIHVGVGIAAVLCLYFLIRYAPWKRIFREIRLPLAQLALIVICIALNTLGDHHAMFHTMRDQIIEELAELLMYFTLCHMTWYYYLKIEKEL